MPRGPATGQPTTSSNQPPPPGDSSETGEQPLPQGWDLGRDYDGKVYYIDHNTHKTTWVDPRDSLTKPASFADCVGDELPVGWEQVIDYNDYNRGVYFVNHVEKQIQSVDPRLEWRGMQEEMLRQYLTTAQEDLENKKELASVKEARLTLAQDEFRHLNSTLSSIHASNTSYLPPLSPDLPDYCNLRQLNASTPLPPPVYVAAPSPIPGGRHTPLPLSPAPSMRRTHSIHENDLYANSRYAASCTNGGGLNMSKTSSNLSLNSTTSTTSTKYDPDLLKADVAHARARVQRLRRELANIHSEVEYKSKGVETLNTVNTKFEMGRGITPEEALAIRSELQNIQQSLVTGEQEKVELMKSLACLKEDLTRLEVTDSSMDVPPISQADTLSIASQTDLTGEEMVPVGARLAELARLRLQYDESRRNVQELQQRLSSLEERISPGQLESDNDRLLLIQEKEQLLRELRSINSRSRNKRSNEELRLEIRKLERDLNMAMETSNRCIADRLKTHEEKQYLLLQLKASMRSVTTLESQLRLLSASTLSMSSSSSLGSLGSSSHASSKGSLSSLSFTDIYGMSTTTAPDPNMLDLQRRVDKILLGSSSTSSAGSGVIGGNNTTMTGNNAVSGSYINSAGGISFSATGNSPTSAAFPMLGNLNTVYGGSSNVMIAGNANRGVSRNQSTEELAASDQNLSSVGGANLSGAVGGVGSSNTRKASSQLSLSPRSSLSSVSPPVSPYDPTLPSYEQAYLSSQERQRRLNLHLATTATPANLLPGATGLQQSNNVYQHQQMESPVDSESGKRLGLVSSTSSSLNVSSSSVNVAGLSPLKRSLGALAGGGANMKPYHRDLDLTDLTSAILSNNNNIIPPPLLSSPSSITAGSSLSSSIYSSSISSQRRTTGQESVSSDQSAPLSPISESAILSDSSSSNSRLNPASRSVSAAVSDESVAGDSGVFEAASSSTSRKDDLGLAMNLETAQIQIKLRYSTPDGLLHIGIEKARNLSVLFIPEAKKVCIKAALLPAIANVSYTFCTRACTNLNKPNFGENFPVAISKPKLVTKTLQVNVWAVDESGRSKDDCLGSAQVSLADFNCTGVSLRWYNVLSFHFMQPEVIKRTTPTPSHRTSLHAKQESEVSMTGGSRVGTLKEESSDESTIISSQTSTLTRNIGPESMHHHQEDVTFYPLEVEYEEGDDDSDQEQEIKVDLVNNFVYPSVEVESTVSSSLPLDTTLETCPTTTQHQHYHHESVDAETNTDTAFIQPPVIKGRLELVAGGRGRLDLAGFKNSAASSIVKRSKTFSPTAPINKSEYSCRLNRSDSDSAMPLYRRLPFQRSSRERRSLHFPSGVTAAGSVGAGSHGFGSGLSASKGGVGRRTTVTGAPKRNQTSLDLELDLAAQNSRLQVLKDEITRLRKIKEELERIKDKGDKELPAWVGEDTLFLKLVQNTDTSTREKSAEEKKMEKLLRRTAKEIYKLRRTKNRTGQHDAQSFREKMAFLANLKSSVPILGEEDCIDTDDEQELAAAAGGDDSISPLSTSFTPTPTPTSMMMINLPPTCLPVNNLSPSISPDAVMSPADNVMPHHHQLHRPLAASTAIGSTIIRLSAADESPHVRVSGASDSSGSGLLRSGLSTETVDTLTEDDTTLRGGDNDSAAASQNSTPTPGRAAHHIQRFVYEVDPELGAFV